MVNLHLGKAPTSIRRPSKGKRVAEDKAFADSQKRLKLSDGNHKGGAGTEADNWAQRYSLTVVLSHRREENRKRDERAKRREMERASEHAEVHHQTPIFHPKSRLTFGHTFPPS